jgi:subtilisin family serine protease
MSTRTHQAGRSSDKPRTVGVGRRRLLYPAFAGFRRPIVHGVPMENPWKRWAASTLPPPRQETVRLIVDSGIREDHPWLRGLVTRGANFTKEDFKDHCGHGTSMALMAVAGSPFPPKLISVKVAEADGRGSPEALIRALEWIAHYQRTNIQIRVIAQFAVGVFSRSLLPGGCKGRCAVCRAAIATAAADVIIVAAAGNTPGRTACPATAGLIAGRNILAVGSTSPQSGIGRVYHNGSFGI